MANFAGATTASCEQMGAMSDPPWDCGCTRCATTESSDEQIAAEVQGVDIVLEAMDTFCGKLADNFEPHGEPNIQCQASFLSVPDFLLSLLDSSDVKTTMTELAALLASLAGLDWAGAWKGPFPADDPIPEDQDPFPGQDFADGLSAACQDASDFMAGLAEGFDTEGVVERNVPSPLDFAAIFSDIATYDYQTFGHQVSKLFTALDRVDWQQVIFSKDFASQSYFDLVDLPRHPYFGCDRFPTAHPQSSSPCGLDDARTLFAYDGLSVNDYSEDWSEDINDYNENWSEDILNDLSEACRACMRDRPVAINGARTMMPDGRSLSYPQFFLLNSIGNASTGCYDAAAFANSCSADEKGAMLASFNDGPDSFCCSNTADYQRVVSCVRPACVLCALDKAWPMSARLYERGDIRSQNAWAACMAEGQPDVNVFASFNDGKSLWSEYNACPEGGSCTDPALIKAVRTVFEVAAKAADLVADGVPPPTAAAEEPPCQNIFSIPSLMDFLLTNTDAGHVKTLAVKAANFAMKLSTVDWQMSSSHIASCTTEGTCDQLSSDNCNKDECWLD
jgi:hypothetical protein